MTGIRFHSRVKPFARLAGCALALLTCSFPALAADTIVEAKVFDMGDAAIRSVLDEAADVPAVWSNAGSRGAAIRTGRPKPAGGGNCQEVATSQMAFTPNLDFSETVSVYCQAAGADKWNKVSEDPNGDPVKRRRARYFIPPGLSAPSVWRVQYDPAVFPTATAAYAHSIFTREPAANPFWRNAGPKGDSTGIVAWLPAADPKCRTLLIVRDDNGEHKENTLGFCPQATGGWLAQTIQHNDAAVKQALAGLRPAYQSRLAGLRAGEANAAPRGSDPTAPGETSAQAPVADKRGGTGGDREAPPPPATAKAPVADGSRAFEAKRTAANQALAQVPAIKIAEECSASVKGAPWGSADGGPGALPKPEEYRAAAAHALRSLKRLYGQLTPEQEAGIDRLWAPFFDHPTGAALAWFQQANPLLDDYLATLADVEATFPAWRDATADTLIATAAASQTFFQVSAPVAQELGERLAAARARLADINSRLEALGDAPNPLAAKCNARARHRKAVGGGDIWALLKKSNFLATLDGRAKGEDDWGAGDIAVSVTFTGEKTEPSHASKLAGEMPESSFKWTGTKFVYASENKNFFSPCSPDVGGGHSTKFSTRLEGEVSPDGSRILRLRGSMTGRFCKNDKTGDVEISTVNVDVPEAVAVLRTDRPSPNDGQRVELFYTSPGVVIPTDWEKWKPKGGEVVVRFANFLAELQPFSLCKVTSGLVASVGCEVGMMRSAEEREACKRKAKEEELRRDKECDAKLAAWQVGKTYVAPAQKPADTVAATPGKGAPPPAQKPAAPPVDDDAAAIKEAIGEHEALARQYEQNAARWAADASREKDPKRREELEKRAAEIGANASAERDIAASLGSGELVKTRTAWDEKQSQMLVQNIRQELDKFAADNKRLEDIHKLLTMGDGHFSGGMDERISAALKSPNASEELAKIDAEVRAKVRAEKAENLARREKEKELADWELQRPVAVAQGAANMAVTITAMAVPGAGPVAVAWGLGTGYVDGGAKGVAMAGARMYSQFFDVAAATYEGAQQGGAWGAAKGAGMSLAMNLFMTKVGPRLQKAVTPIEPRGPAVPKLAAAKGGAPEVGVKTAEQHYELAKAKAKSPEELAQLQKQFGTIEQRQSLKQEINQAIASADQVAAKARRPDGTVDTSHPEYKKAQQQLQAETQKIHEKYAAQENRDLLHGEAIEAAGLTENDIKLSGGKPKNAASDMDVTASSYKAGKDYVAALQKKAGVGAVEYGDRWVLSNDVTVWKPTAGAKAGSSAFEAEAAFSASKGSDKFATASGQKYTKGEATGDTQGAVIDNMKKAGEAGLGKEGAKDMHVIGKSADKALEISGADASPELRKTLADLRGHKPPELAGVVQLGASPQVKAKQTQQFLQQTQKAMAKSFQKATEGSWNYERNLIAEQNAARQAGDMKRVAEIQQELATNRSSNRTALATVADVAPELVTSVLPPNSGAAPGKPAAAGQAAPAAPPSLSLLLKRDRDSEGKNLPPLKGDDPSLGDLAERCKEAAKRIDAKLKTAKPGSDEAKYLAELKNGLENGGRNPAEAVQQVRALSGHELAVVLKQLGVETKRR